MEDSGFKVFLPSRLETQSFVKLRCVDLSAQLLATETKLFCLMNRSFHQSHPSSEPSPFLQYGDASNVAVFEQSCSTNRIARLAG